MGSPAGFPAAVGVCGPRAVSPAAALACSRVASAVAASGAAVLAPCCGGAGAAFLAPSVLAVPGSSVFASFGPGGAGACGSSAVAAVSALAAAGVPVAWWAGGGPSVPLRARLPGRSLALARALAAAGGVLVALVSAPPPGPWAGSGLWRSCGGSGSWSSVAASALLGCSVFVPGCCWSPLPGSALPVLPAPGSWAPARLFGLPGALWSPAPAPSVVAPSLWGA